VKTPGLRLVRDKTGDFLLAVGIGFLINFLLGVAMPQLGPFIAGTVAGVIVREGPLKGALAGFLAGTLGGLASIGLWVATNLLSLPVMVGPAAFEFTVAVLTAEYAVLSLSGGIIGSIMAMEHWPRIYRFLTKQKLPSFPGFPSSPVELEKQED
jgi:hypothetical protein